MLEEILQSENIWYTRNKSYAAAIGLKVIAYNLMVMSKMKARNEPRETMIIDSC